MSASLFSNQEYGDIPKNKAAEIAAKDRAALRAARAGKKSLADRLEDKRLRREANFKREQEERKQAMLGMTNIKARKYGLDLPNNPEAIEYEKTHCISCGCRHHDAKAYENLNGDYLKLLEQLGQQSLGMLCCSCFSRVKNTRGDGKIINMSLQPPDEGTLKEIYEPESIEITMAKHRPHIKFDIEQGDEIDREKTIESLYSGRYNSRYSC